MRLGTEFIKLPLRFDVERLGMEVSQFGEAEWLPHPEGYPGNWALPLIAAHGDPSNNATKWPMQPTPFLRRCPYVWQVLASFGAVLGRTRLMRLDGNAEATPHSDTNYYWLDRVRVHVPILTHPAVQFVCGTRSLHMPAGEAWIFDTWRSHKVVNPEPTQRIHLVADTVGSAIFWELVERGQCPFAPGHSRPDPPQFVPFVPEAGAEVEFEQRNQPLVMSPWEQESLLALLDEELRALQAGQKAASEALWAEVKRFQRQWRALWARYGETPEGWPAYGACLQQFQLRLPPFEHRLRLSNGTDAVEIIRQMVIRPGLNPDLAAPPSFSRPSGAGPVRAQPQPAIDPRHSIGQIERPVFIVSPPRAGTSLLFETLSRSPSVYTIGGESHALIESIPKLHPASQGFASNRLTAAEADVETGERLVTAFVQQMRNRNGRPPGPGGLRLLEKTPKNALRVPFLNAIFPDAFFIYLYRDPWEEISSILEAWRSGRFVTYPQLPGWEGPPWSLVLIPGWQNLVGKPLAEIAAEQWATTTGYLLDDLEPLPPERWCVARYERLVADPQTEVERLCRFVELEWDQVLTAPLPLARHTLTAPQPEKWRRNAEALEAVVPRVAEVAARARDLFGQVPAVIATRRRSLPAAVAPPPATKGVAQRAEVHLRAVPAGNTATAQAFHSVHTASFPQLLRDLRSSLLVSTYQSGRVVVVREGAGGLNTHFCRFQSPMGLAVGARYVAIGTKHHVWEYRNQPAVARTLDSPGKHDACFLPRACHVTGDIRIHELAFAGAELWVVNTSFSCLCTLDDDHSFVPRWRPRFVTELDNHDRCHLNGMAVIDGRVRFVTALGQTDTVQGWRETKASGGCVIDVESGEIVVAGLSMPHSPRWHEGRLWLLESGKGTVVSVDVAAGRVETVAALPGFTRGLAFAGPYALIGLSQVRESLFGGIPLTERVQERLCGVWGIDLRSGQVVGFLRFEETVQEVFDVQILYGLRFPELIEPESELVAGAYVLPPAALAEVPQTRVSFA